MKASTFNGCRVYNLSSGKTMPEWLSNSKKRALAKDEEYSRRLELIQDFEMTTASQCIRMTKDHEHIIVTGTYPPLIRCYTTSDMAMKFQRGMTCEIVGMETLSDDYGKLVFLQSDRTLCFHAPYGTHYSIRVPTFGRDILYNHGNCDLYVGASGDEIYRLNLETGQFKEPFQLTYKGCNKMSQNPVHQLLACGGQGGVCEFWDPRSRKAVARISAVNNEEQNSALYDITAMKFDIDGLTFGLGTAGGKCNFYDIRSHKPFYVKEHQYGLPIVNITYHNASRHIITTDKKIVKIWERDEPNMGKILTNIETPADINDLLVVNDRRGQSGLIMMAGEQSRIMTYYIPQLGPAPRWCSFLENLTEELEESSGQNVYDDFKFLTMKEVEDLGATGLLGTPMLKGYMHGFFMEMKLYSKLRAVSKPFEYEEHRKQKIKEKIEAKRQSRITAIKRLPKVNSALAEKYMRRDGLLRDDDDDVDINTTDNINDGITNTNNKKAKNNKGVIIDERFSKLFEREEFQQDEDAIEYKLRNPTKSTANKGNRGSRGMFGEDSDDELADLYDPVEDMNNNNNNNNTDSDNNDYEDIDEDDDYSDDENDDFEPISAQKQYDSDDSNKYNKKNNKKINKSNKYSNNQEEDEDGDIIKASKKMELKQQQGMKTNNKRMYALNDSATISSAIFSHTDEAKTKRRMEKSLSTIPLVERIQQKVNNIKLATSTNYRSDNNNMKFNRDDRNETSRGSSGGDRGNSNDRGGRGGRGRSSDSGAGRGGRSGRSSSGGRGGRGGRSSGGRGGRGGRGRSSGGRSGGRGGRY